MSTKKAPLKNAQFRELGVEIRAIRELRGYSQLQLAQMIGHRHRTYITRLENGQISPSLNTLIKIGKALEMNLLISFIPKSAS